MFVTTTMALLLLLFGNISANQCSPKSYDIIITSELSFHVCSVKNIVVRFRVTLWDENSF